MDKHTTRQQHSCAIHNLIYSYNKQHKHNTFKHIGKPHNNVNNEQPHKTQNKQKPNNAYKHTQNQTTIITHNKQEHSNTTTTQTATTRTQNTQTDNLYNNTKQPIHTIYHNQYVQEQTINKHTNNTQTHNTNHINQKQHNILNMIYKPQTNNLEITIM